MKRCRSTRPLQHTGRLEGVVVQQPGRSAESERCERQQHRLERHGAAGRDRVPALQGSQFGRQNGIRRRGEWPVVFSAPMSAGREARRLINDRPPVPQISWIRRRDFHVLTSSTFTYTNDERFQVLHPEGSDDWTLQIKYVQDRDNGTYECQVITTAPGNCFHFFESWI